jgi:signal transduction histidine kinase
MARHSLTEARRSVLDLRAAALEDHDLAAALRTGATLWTAGSGVDVEVDVSGETGSLPENIAHHMLRIAQEAVTNVLKHAHADKIALKLRREANELNLSVEDDGCGFEHEEAFTTDGHFGLIGMRERAEQVGGELRLHSQPGHGTQLEVTVPLS